MKRSLHQILSYALGLKPQSADRSGHNNGEHGSSDYTQLMKSIGMWFERDKPYLNPSLTVADVAAALKSNRSYVSRAINEVAGETFYTFVNGYRFSHFLQILDSAAVGRYTLEAIARQSGFNSMTTFYGTFRMQKGCTPKQYIRAGACRI